MQTELVLPLWLIIILGILACFSIIACIYKIFAYRRISIVAKKADYLIEDLIYKSEYITPSIEAVVKLSSYVDLANDVLKKNTDSLIKFVMKNKEANAKSIKKVKEVIRESK